MRAISSLFSKIPLAKETKGADDEPSPKGLLQEQSTNKETVKAEAKELIEAA